MNLIFLFLTVVFSSLLVNNALTASIVDCNCPQYIRAPDPVCGPDGKQYYDECRAKCAGVKLVVPCPCICPHVYAPVCVKGKQYGNRCEAKCAKVDDKDIADGPCRLVCACPKILKPVCSDGKINYDNDCLAKCAGAINIVEGECQKRKPLCICPAIYQPVCGYRRKTFSNNCVASCEGAENITDGPCKCVCPRIYKPVCVNGQQYSNECEAKCANVEVMDIIRGPCPVCRCTKELRPVCHKGRITYDNPCLARCNGAENFVDGRCPSNKPVCLCPAVFLPVCGYIKKTYSNLCFAKCDGAEHISHRSCKCACPKIDEPVCGTNGVNYANECRARCAGVSKFTKGPCCKPCAVRCDSTYEPVCADGKTYRNKCETLCLCPPPKLVTPGACPDEC